MDLAKLPGVAETIDWTQALVALGQEELEAGVVDATLGSVLKYHEDIERVRDAGLRELRRPRPRDLAMPTATAGDAVVRKLVTFGRILREAGLEVGPGRLQDALRGLDQIDLTSREEVYHALRCTLVSRRDDIDAFDMAFAVFWERAPSTAPDQPIDLGFQATTEPPKRVPSAAPAKEDDRPSEDESPPVLVASSRDEVLRRKDFADMTPAELRRVRRLIATLPSAEPMRRSHRLRPARAGDVLDMRRTLQAAMHTEGMPLRLAYRKRKLVPRKLVFLCDVSGSMEPYARAMIMFLEAAARAGRHVEAFAFGTRLSRLTPQLRGLDPVRSLRWPVRRCPTGAAARASASRFGLTTRVRAARPDARSGRRRRLGRLGARRPRAARYRTRAPAPPGPPPGVGEPAEGPHGVRAAGGRDAGRAAPLGRLR